MESERTLARMPSLKLNAVSNWLPLGVNIIIGFLLMPYLIDKLGPTRYGIWALVGSFVGYYGFLRLGVGTGIMRYVPFYVGRKDNISVSEVVSTGLVIFLAAGLIILILSMITAESIAHFFNEGSEFAALIRVLGLAAAIECPMRMFDTTVLAHERWIACNLITTMASIMRAIGLVGCVYFGYGLVEMGYVVLSVSVFCLISVVIIFIRVCRNVRIGISKVKFPHVKALISFGLLSIIVALAWSYTLQGHKLIIGKLISMEAVTIYAVAAMIMKNARNVVVSPNRVFWPRFAHLDGQSHLEEARSLFCQATKYNTLFASLIILVVILFGPAFIELWMKRVEEGFEMVYPVLTILAIGYLIETSLAVIPSLLSGMGLQKVKAALAIAEGILGLGLSILMTWKMGMAGTALGFTISIALMRGFLSSWYVCSLFKISVLKYYLDSLVRPWLIMATIAAIAYYSNLPDYINGWPSLIFLSLAITVLFVICIYIAGMNSSERRDMLSLIGTRLAKNKN